MLLENPHHPGAAWSISGFDDAVVSAADMFRDEQPSGDPAEYSPEEQPTMADEQIALWVFGFRGTALGETPLRFVLLDDGATIDTVWFVVRVADDACDGDDGVAAPRCQREHPGEWPNTSEREYGSWWQSDVGEPVRAALRANAGHPNATWRLEAFDPTVLELTSTQDVGPRTQGNWDTEDSSESGSFLTITEFLFTAAAAGESPIELKLVDPDGSVVESFAVTVSVSE